MYYKGGSMLHMMRQLLNDDAKWRAVLRGLNATFWHQTVTGAQVQEYINKTSGMDFSKTFQQYLTTTMIPTLEYKIERDSLSYHWTNVVPGFAMPVRASVGARAREWLRPTETWKTYSGAIAATDSVKVDPNFYVLTKNASAPRTP
jgi:aminopeptidase N